jgi:hypothetical protein
MPQAAGSALQPPPAQGREGIASRGAPVRGASRRLPPDKICPQRKILFGFVPVYQTKPHRTPLRSRRDVVGDTVVAEIHLTGKPGVVRKTRPGVLSATIKARCCAKNKARCPQRDNQGQVLQSVAPFVTAIPRYVLLRMLRTTGNSARDRQAHPPERYRPYSNDKP